MIMAYLGIQVKMNLRPIPAPSLPPPTSVSAKNRTHKAHLLIFPNNAILRIWLASVWQKFKEDLTTKITIQSKVLF